MEVQQKGGFSLAGLAKTAATTAAAKAKTAATTAAASAVQKAKTAATATVQKATSTVKGKVTAAVAPAKALASPATAPLVPSTTVSDTKEALMKIFKWILIIAAVLAVIYGLYVLYKYIKQKYFSSTTDSATSEIANQDIDQLIPLVNTTETTTEGFQAAGASGPTIAASEATLLNMQPLTIKQAGFLGPLPEGKFEPQTAILKALRAGFRSFVLQIDYLESEKDPKKYARALYPTLLYKDAQNTLVSSNSGKIADVARAIQSFAFNTEVANSTQPILLYLHIVRTPSPMRQKDAYMKFLSNIAKELGPLASYHLGMTALGTFHRQKNEDILFMTPIEQFKGKVIILSNADTSVFRSQGQAQKYKPAEDLDYWVNARVYLDGDYYNAGVATTPETGKGAAAVVVNLADVLALGGVKMDSFAMKGKSRFVIAMPDPMKNPKEEDLAKALDSLAINMIPLDIFNFDGESVKGLMNAYKFTSYRPKAAIFRKEKEVLMSAQQPAATQEQTPDEAARIALAKELRSQQQQPTAAPPTGNIFL